LLIVVAIAVAVLGYYRGWFFLATADDLRRDEFNVDLRVDKGKVKSDVEAAREAARGLGENAQKSLKDATHSETVKGVVTDATPQHVTVKRADNSEVQIALTPEAVEIKVGDRVQIVCVTENGQRVARTIAVERPVQP